MLDDENWLTVVGVVKNAVRGEWAAAPEDEVYLPALQTRELMNSPHPMSAYLTYVVRTEGDPAALAPSLRAAIRSIDPTLPISEVRTMRSIVAQANARARFQTLLLAVFAAAAALLAADRHLRRHELRRFEADPGDRRAHGARRRPRLASCGSSSGQGMAVAVAGAAAGLVAASLLTRLMAGLLYGVGASDPATYLGVALLLLSIALTASWVPARRAARIDPMKALRSE